MNNSKCLSFAGLPKRNLQTVEVPLTSLRSHCTTIQLMGFAGLQVSFPSHHPKTMKNSIGWNNIAKMWKTRGKVRNRTKGDFNA